MKKITAFLTKPRIELIDHTFSIAEILCSILGAIAFMAIAGLCDKL